MSPYDAQDVHSLAVENAKIMTRLDSIGEGLIDLKSEFKELRGDLKADRESYVTRTEFDDFKLSRDREIRELKDKNKSRVAAWSGIGGLVISFVLGIIVIVEKIAT